MQSHRGVAFWPSDIYRNTSRPKINVRQLKFEANGKIFKMTLILDMEIAIPLPYSVIEILKTI